MNTHRRFNSGTALGHAIARQTSTFDETRGHMPARVKKNHHVEKKA
jgi:hypothetical protein